MLGRLLASGLPVDSALDRFSEVRPPVCRFVQDVSRQVGVSGAQSDALEHAKILQTMRSTAQQRVDDFYAQLERFGSHISTGDTP